MTRRDVTRALRRFWPLALLVFLLFCALGVAASFLPQKQYQANAVLFAEPTNANSQQYATTVVPLIMPALVDQVGTRLFADQVNTATPDARGATLSASNVAGTSVLTVTAQSSSPSVAATAANAAAHELQLKPIAAVKLSILDPAAVPTSPSSPRKAPILLGCGVLGLILGLLAALVGDALRKRVPDADTIRTRYGLAVIGEIHHDRRVKRLSPAELFTDERSSGLAEEYQRLGTNLALLREKYQTVAVTSWREGEGKTTVVANLAWTLALMGRRVTIADLDLRRPSIHQRFGLDVAGGVSDLSLDTARNGLTPGRRKPTDIQGLKVLTAGTPARQPARVIEEVFPTIKGAFGDHLVLIDTPPMLAAETTLIASLVDALVIVMDVRRREPAELETMMQLLKLAQTPILGVVLNHVRRSSQSGRYYYAQSHRPPSDEPATADESIPTGSAAGPSASPVD